VSISYVCMNFYLIKFVMVALWNRAGHYIFILWFHLLSFFFSSPNLSRRKLDVCHTSTHGVALKPNSITLAGLELVRSWFEPASVMEFAF